MNNQRLFWRIVKSIESSIEAGFHPVGSRLPPERELADTFEVSRPTIREAIIALEVRGRVEVKTGSGVYVLNSQINGNTTSNINAFEVTQARALIEGEVAAIAATTITETELKQLNETLVTMKNKKLVEKSDEEFHKIIVNSTRNSAMIQAVENLWKLRSTTQNSSDDYHEICSKDNKQTLNEHKAIYNALKSRDVTEARKTMHSHFNRLINNLFDAVEAKTLEEVKRKNSEKRDLYAIPKIS